MSRPRRIDTRKPMPGDHEMIARHREVIATVAWNERGSEPGQCPWCLNRLEVDMVHAYGCLMDELEKTALFRERRLRANGGRKGLGLKAYRKQCRYTQVYVAQAIGKNQNYYSRLERLDGNLSTTVAAKLAGLYGLRNIEDLYVEPDFD